MAGARGMLRSKPLAEEIRSFGFLPLSFFGRSTQDPGVFRRLGDGSVRRIRDGFCSFFSPRSSRCKKKTRRSQ